MVGLPRRRIGILQRHYLHETTQTQNKYIHTQNRVGTQVRTPSDCPFTVLNLLHVISSILKLSLLAYGPKKMAEQQGIGQSNTTGS